MENQSKKMVQIVYDALDEKLGEDIEILKVDETNRGNRKTYPQNGSFGRRRVRPRAGCFRRA